MDIKHIVENFKTAKILCIGHIMLDRFVYGDVERISPEAPVPILKVYDEKKMPGGVGNVVRNIKALGGGSHIISIIGDDSYGNILQDLLEYSADLALIKSKKVPTIVKTRYICLNQQLLRVDEEPADIISSEIKEKVIKNIEAKVLLAIL
jgi:D-beta-D-heptose 7-phosphate kinase/D-beta-D-heptose 1-phosphate adenosyltransferase